MERWHLEYLSTTFNIEGTTITVLDIPDIYGRDDAHLIHILLSKLRAGHSCQLKIQPDFTRPVANWFFICHF